MSTSAMTMVTASRENVTCLNYLTTVIAPEDCDFMTTSSLVFVIVSIVLIIWGLFNNILLLVIIFTNGRQMRTIPNIFIANMAFLGILFLVIVSGGNILIFGQIAFHVEIVRSYSVSSALFFIQIFVSVASFTTLVVLGLDRYLAIVHPLRSRPYRTKKRAVITNGFVWIIAGLTMIPVFLAGGIRQDVFQAYSDPDLRKSIIIFITFAYVLPIILLLLMYVAILKVIWFNPTTKRLQGKEQERRWKQRIQVFKSLSRVVLSFMLHYGYFFAVFLWLINGGHTRVSARVSNVLFYSAILILYMNTCLNPVIYALKQESFRPFVYELLCPKTCNLRKPAKDALYTTQPNGNASEPMAFKTLQNGQEGVVRTSSGRGSTGVNLDGNIEENVISPTGIVNEGFHGNDKTRDEKTEIGSSDGTCGDVFATSYVGPERQTYLQLNEIEANV